MTDRAELMDAENHDAESIAETPVIDETQALRLLEAVLFASPEPVSFKMIEEQMGPLVDVAHLLDMLRDHYKDRGVHLVETDGIWSFRTASDLAQALNITKQPRRKLPRVAAEVLAIIAYHQPVTRGEIESIRGVETSKGTLDMLLELGWVRPGKRREVPGRPLTWKTTPEFLSHFNLASLNDLPGLEDLKASGLMDAKPVLAAMSIEEGDTALGKDLPDTDDEDFAVWIGENP